MSARLESEAAREGKLLSTFHDIFFVHAKPLPANTSLVGQTAIVTGSNGGLGFEASRQLLKLGLSRLIVAVRSKTSGEAAAAKLRQEFSQAEIVVSLVDMANYDSILQFVQRCRDLDYIDYAILNAGVQQSAFVKCEKTGHEMDFQVNYISTVLLTMLLASVMKEKFRNAGKSKTKPPMLSVVGSDTMYMSKFATKGAVFPRMDAPEGFSQFQQYFDSKFLLMVFLGQLAKKTNPDDVIINVCNPGLTSGTSLGADSKINIVVKTIVKGLVRLIGRPVEAGASVYIHAILGEGKESHGSFISEWRIKPYPLLMYSNESAEFTEKLWGETMEELRFASDLGIRQILLPDRS